MNQRASLKKWLILSLRQGKYKMNLEHLITLKSKDMLQKGGGGGCGKGIGANLKKLSMAKSNKINCDSNALQPIE